MDGRGKIREKIRRAIRCHAAGELEAAEILYNEILEKTPHEPEALYRLGLMACEAQALDEAQDLFRQAIVYGPHRPEYPMALAGLHLKEGRAEEAVDVLEAFLKNHPGEAGPARMLGNLLLSGKRIMRGIRVVRRYLAARPADGGMTALLSTLHSEAGDLEERIEALRRAMALQPGRSLLHSALLNSLAASDRAGDEDICRCARDWDRNNGSNPGLLPPLQARIREPGAKLRIGILSRTFHDHTTATLMLPLLERLREHAGLYLYDDSGLQDSIRQRFQELAHHWRETFRMDEADAARAIRADPLDVLIDASGHFDHGRLGILRHRPAPVQVHFYGSATTQGLRTVDYRISDDISDPPGACESTSTERILRLPGGFHTYRPLRETEALCAPPCLEKGHVTFGSVASLHKITPTTLSLWLDALRAVPGSRLMVAREIFQSDPEVASHVREKLVAHGLPADRIELRGADREFFRSLKVYNEMDIALDTHPYAGVTTTCDALWMGVPVVTLQGSRFISRISSGMLTRMGLGQLVAREPAGFGRIADEWATDQPRLTELRGALRERFARCSLGNAEQLAVEMVAALQRCCGG